MGLGKIYKSGDLRPGFFLDWEKNSYDFVKYLDFGNVFIYNMLHSKPKLKGSDPK
jgi:hypothetical protein